MTASAAPDATSDYRGWLAGFLIFAVILAVGIGVWVRFHG